MADILGIGLSGLSAAQRSLSTTSHNISNVNTDGYSRQAVEQVARAPQLFGSSYLGSGVEISNIKRVYDEFLVNQVRSHTSSFGSIDTFQQFAASIDNLLGNPSTGLGAGIENFYGAVHQLAANPSSLAARQALLSESNSLVDRFHAINDNLNRQYAQVNTALGNALSEVNSLASSIASLNARVVTASSAANGSGANDLLDQRDLALEQLSKLVSVSTVKQGDGTINVFVGNGQPLVVGGKVQSLVAVANRYEPTRYEIGYSSGGGSNVEITSQISGGTIGGLLNFRSQILDATKNALGRVAMGLADGVNTQHTLGMDLNGALGGAMFTAASPEVLPSGTNTGTGSVSGALINPNDLTTSNYRLVANGGNSYTLTRLSDGQTFAINTGGTSPYTTTEIDGVSLAITAGAAAGDSFLIRPTRRGADEIGVVISDPTKVAAAVPVKVSTSLSNTGSATAGAVSVNKPGDRVVIQFTGPAAYDVVDQTTGATLAQGIAYTSGSNISYNGWTVQVTDGGTGPQAGDKFYVDEEVTSADAANTGGAAIGLAAVSPPDPNLTDTVTITFTSPTTFNVAGATTGTPTVGVSYTSGGVISYNGWSLAISGTPAAGDTFTIGPNTTGVGDNGNMQQIAGLQNKLSLAGGTASFQDAYGQIVADVGTKTREAGISRDATNALLKQSVEARDATSGVNLDEEAANMLKFQQAYQAAAKVIAVSDTLFQSILSAVSR